MNTIKHPDKRLRWLKVAIIFLAGLGIAMVIRRTLVLSGIMPTANVPKAFSFDKGFSDHPVITLLHIIPGALFMVLGLIQFMPGIHSRHNQFYRWSGRAFIVDAYIVGCTALILPFVKQPIGGISEATGIVFYSIVFLICISLAVKSILSKQKELYQEWVIRTFSIGLAIATVRIFMAGAFAIFRVLPQNFMGTAFWLGFTMHLIAAEVWINYSRIFSIFPYKTIVPAHMDQEVVEQ